MRLLQHVAFLHDLQQKKKNPVMLTQVPILVLLVKAESCLMHLELPLQVSVHVIRQDLDPSILLVG